MHITNTYKIWEYTLDYWYWFFHNIGSWCFNILGISFISAAYTEYIGYRPIPKNYYISKNKIIYFFLAYLILRPYYLFQWISDCTLLFLKFKKWKKCNNFFLLVIWWIKHYFKHKFDISIVKNVLYNSFQ